MRIVLFYLGTILTLSFPLLAKDSMTSEDKLMHAGVSFGINSFANAGCEAVFQTDGDSRSYGCLIGSALLTGVIGLAKEINDGDKNTREEHTKDMIANGAGILASSVMIRLTW